MTNPCPNSKSAPTSPSGQQGQYILTKVSKSAIRYFYTGSETLVEVAGGGFALVASTSLFAADAKGFPNQKTALPFLDTLNKQGIGGASWKVSPRHPFECRQRPKTNP